MNSTDRLPESISHQVGRLSYWSIFVERIKQQRKLCADVQHSAVHLICYL